MAHYAKVENGIVVDVIVAEADYADTLPGTWIKTSYNTSEGKHLEGGEPLRKNFAGVGFSYDESRDAFIPPKPFDSWELDENKCVWIPPVAYPNDGGMYVWDEQAQQWVK